MGDDPLALTLDATSNVTVGESPMSGPAKRQ